MKLLKYKFVGLFVFSSICAIAQDGVSYYVNKQHYGTYRIANKSSKTYALDNTLSEIARKQIEGKISDEKKSLGLKDDDYESNETNTTTTTQKATGTDKRFETLQWKNGNVYIGNTVDGSPHGQGSITFASDGMIMRGEFRNGQANGQMEIIGKNYIQKGKFVNGNPVGEQRYEYNDGKQNFVEIRDLDKGITTIQYADKSGFSGTVDDKGEYVKGKVIYQSGITFEGEFANGRPYTGIWQHEGRTMIGEFGENDQTKDMYLKYGFHYSPKDKSMTFGNFNKNMKRINYCRLVSSNNTVTQTIYGENESEIYVFVHFSSGNAFWLKGNQDGHDYLGVRYNKDTEEIEPIIYSKKDGIQQLNQNHPLYEKAIQCSKEVTPAINAGKKDYETKVAPFTSMIDNWIKSN